MKRVIGFLFIVALFVALPRAAFAQDHANSPKAEFNLTKSLVVGTTTLEPGLYTFQCLFVDGKDVLVVKSAEDGKEVARVPCTLEQLSRKIELSDFRSITRSDGAQALTAVRIKGEMVGHRLELD